MDSLWYLVVQAPIGYPDERSDYLLLDTFASKYFVDKLQALVSACRATNLFGTTCLTLEVAKKKAIH